MGLLDDAIREHLDLKRRRGADPTEVERAEREALGPVRRGPEESRPDDADPEHENGREYAGPDEPELTEPWDQDAESDLPEPIGEAEPLSEAATRIVPDPQPAPAPPVPEPEDEPLSVGEETAEYDVEGELEHEPEEKDEDVLEETPEFLQDTPDHDRLWFEQRPPRDFDFDG